MRDGQYLLRLQPTSLNKKYMNKLLLSILFLTSGLQANAQFQNLFQDTVRAKNSIEVFGDYNAGSNGITNAFVNKFYRKSYISEDLKNTVFSRLDEINHVGGDFNAGLTYTHFNPDSNGLWGLKNTGYFVGLKSRQHIDGRFTDDLFKIFFNGNEAFKGKKADLSDFDFTSLAYQQFEFGIIKDFDCKENKCVFGAGLSILNGQNHTSVTAGNSSLFTEENGEYIDFTTNLTVQQSDTSNKQFGATNGIGLSTDLFFSYSTPAGSTLKLEVSDLGFIRWNDQSKTVKLDTSYHFEGISVSNIFNFDDPAYASVPSDSSYIASFLRNTKKGSYNTFLPAMIALNFSRQYDHFTFLTGLKYRLNANYLPHLSLGAAYNFDPKFYISLTTGFGGYTKLNLGLELAKGFANGFTVLAGSQFVYGYIVPAQGTAQGAYISLRQNF